MLTRRQAIKLGTAGGAGFFLATRFGAVPRLFAQAVPGPTILDPTLIPKYVTPLVIPPAMPRADKLRPAGMSKSTDYYEIAVRQFTQQILPATDQFGLATGFATTPVWSYCSALAPLPVPQGGTLHYPALTIEAKVNRPNRVKWINQLVDAQGNYLPHLLPVDQTLHWANPPGGAMHRDHQGSDGTAYTGPVPSVIHLHGAHVPEHSDGHPEAWFLPAAKNIPAGFATTGTFYDFFGDPSVPGRKSPLASQWTPGSAVFEYPNDQRATTLWYHDHSLGMTRVNVYAGPAGFYILRGGPGDLVLDLKGNPAVLPGPAPKVGDLPGTKYYEIPIVMQDRSFKSDGSLFYPDNRAFFEGLAKDQLAIPFRPDPASDIPPIWNPEFFGNTIVVNGYTWPFLTVEKRRYRFRLLNGCDSRFLILQFADAVTGLPATGVDVWQIGAEQGYLAAPFHVTDPLSTAPLNNSILMAPAERADIIVDFTAVPAGTTVRLINIAPDEPFGGFDPAGPVADPATTGQVMEFRVIRATSRDATTPPAQLVLPAGPVQAAPAVTRQLTLNELMSAKVFAPFDVAADAFVLLAVDAAGQPVVVNGQYVRDDAGGTLFSQAFLDPAVALPAGVTFAEFGPMAAFLGTFDAAGNPLPLAWNEPITETPQLNTSEVWEIHNFTADAHPIHIHLVQFQVINREPIGNTDPALVRPPEGWETGFKDTVISYPGEITRVQSTFDLAGLYVWHCHIVEHEDNEMMRPYQVLP